MDGFVRSDEMKIAEQLLNAFESNDQELVDQLMKRPQVQFLDTEVRTLFSCSPHSMSKIVRTLSNLKVMGERAVVGDAVPNAEKNKEEGLKFEMVDHVVVANNEETSDLC